MAKPYKSVLETHNESLKHRLPTAEEEAIEPVYPEEYLVRGPSGAALSGLSLASGLSKAEKAAAKAAQRERIAGIQIGSKVRDIKADKAAAEEFAKTKWGQATNEDLKKRLEEAAKVRDVKKVINKAISSTERMYLNLNGEAGMAIGSEMANQNRNAAGDTYKKGGAVKATASRRGDGIASRGKTKGRFV
jgi:hypothetical protein